MVFQFKGPYSRIWKKGYLVTKKDGKQIVVLYNSNKERSTVSYPRYLMTNKLNRFLLDTEVSEHINKRNPINVIENLQIKIVKSILKRKQKAKYE